MSYIEGESRNQSLLFPEILDDYITQDNLVRFIDVFVDGLKVEELGFTRSIPEGTGRPPYDPRDLLKLYMCVKVSPIEENVKRTRNIPSRPLKKSFHMAISYGIVDKHCLYRRTDERNQRYPVLHIYLYFPG